MKNYIELSSKITASGGTSTSYKTTIPKIILDKMELTSGDKITWRVYDNSNKVEVIFKDKYLQQIAIEKTRKENYKKYIKGSKKKGVYVFNKEKDIEVGAYIDKSTAKDNVDLLVGNNWDTETVESCKLNVEYEITSERYPLVRNNDPYYCLTRADYDNLYKDTVDLTAFKNISYDELQEIIKSSINY